MKKLLNKKVNMRKIGAFFLVGMLGSVITGCGGGSSSGGYKAEDPVDRAPYFGIGNGEVKTALENGTRADVNIRKPVEIYIGDDKGIKSYYVEIDNVVVAKMENLSGLESIVSLNLTELKDQDSNGDTSFTLKGGRIYDARIVAVDSSNQSTIANFDLNTKEFYDYIAMIGSATAAGWERTAAIPFEPHATIEGRFIWKGHLNAGEIKFPLAPIPEDWCCIEWIMPEADKQSVTNPAMKVIPSGGPDNKWQVPVAGEYTIVIDQKTQKVHFGAPAYELGMVGDGTVAGWNLNGAVRFERDAVDPGVFTTVTNLAATGGEQALKLFGQANGENYEWSNGIWIFAPSSAADLPTDAPGPIVVKVGANSSADDMKWKVSAEKAGTYLIRVNLKDNTILFTKQN